MPTTTPRELDYLRLTALASDIKQLIGEFEDRLCEGDLHALRDLSSQLKGMSSLLIQDDYHWFINLVVKTAMDEYVRINLNLGSEP